ncbi:MAG: alpha/beta hydrolase, partial [Firmicutes bacterium]|nr:alpha/beta hydrolase [Bacillota bacterium]
MNWIKEENYEITMKTLVEPFVDSRTESGTFERVPGEYIYYEHYKAEEPKGVIVISHGFTESVKKFTESVYYMLQAGYEVWGLDHRGHGRSIRLIDNPHIVHAENFDDYVLDLVYFTEELVKPASGDLPLYLYCHSMGGCIGARTIAEYQHLFDKAVLSSPMLGLNFGRVPVGLVYAVATIMGIGERRKNAFGSDGSFDPEPDFENSSGSSECRYYYYFNKTLEDPYIQTCAPSIQWGKEAAKACSYVFTEADMIKIPVLLCQAGADTV